MLTKFVAAWVGLAWACSAAHAEPCVKIRTENGHSCMKFSAEERQKAAAIGLRLGAPYAAVKRDLVRHGWSVDQKWMDENAISESIHDGLVCGNGWDAVCATAFRKKQQTVSLVLSGANAGTPLIGVELETAP